MKYVSYCMSISFTFRKLVEINFWFKVFFGAILVTRIKCKNYHVFCGKVVKLYRNKSLVQSFFLKQYLSWIDNVKNIMYSIAITIKL